MKRTDDIASSERTVTVAPIATTPVAVDELIDEIDRLRLRLALARHKYADLLAAARACAASAARGDADPLFWIIDELRTNGQLPAPLLIPEQVAAATRPRIAP